MVSASGIYPYDLGGGLLGIYVPSAGSEYRRGKFSDYLNDGIFISYFR